MSYYLYMNVNLSQQVVDHQRNLFSWIWWRSSCTWAVMHLRSIFRYGYKWMEGWTFGYNSDFFSCLLLIMGTLPFWDTLRRNPKCRGALFGINAAVVGILIAAFYTPIWTSSILSAKDFAFGSILFSMMVFWKLSPWVIVITGAYWWVSSNASLILGFSYLIIAMKNEKF